MKAERGNGARRGPDRSAVDSSEMFAQYRPLLFSVAYGMLGCVMDAENVVQEAFLRWQRTPRAEVRSPKAYLSAVVTRLCIDHLRSARARREEYVGPWLPEPLLSEDVTLYSDGGGKTRAALKPIRGPEKVARFLAGILGKVPPGFAVRRTRVNGRPGLVGYFGDGSPQSVVTLEVADGHIQAIRLVVNPEKLGSVPSLRRTEGGEDPG